MSEQYGQHRRRERVEEGFDRYARRVHRLLYSCDGCSCSLHQTHNYGNHSVGSCKSGKNGLTRESQS